MDKQVIINKIIAEMDKVADVTDSPSVALAAVDFVSIYKNLTNEKLKAHLKRHKNGYRKWVTRKWNQRRYDTAKPTIIAAVLPLLQGLQNMGMTQESAYNFIMSTLQDKWEEMNNG